MDVDLDDSRPVDEGRARESSEGIVGVDAPSMFFKRWSSNNLSTSFWMISANGTMKVVLDKTDFTICLAIDSNYMRLAS